MILTVTMNAAIDKRYVVERMIPGEVMRVKECVYTAGGKGLNVSRVAVIAGEAVTATGFLGGHAGDYVSEELTKSGVHGDFVRVNGESRSCINIYSQEDRSQTELLEPGITVTPEDTACFIDKYSGLLAKCDAVVISGSLPRGMDAGFYTRLIEGAKKAGRPVLLDTSGESLRLGITAKPDFVKPNRDEIKALLGVDIENLNDVITAAQKLHEDGVGVVAVSMGRDGVVVACREGVFRGLTPDVKVVNTVGSGDAMTAAFAVGFVRGLPIEETIRLAVSISTANALREQTGYFLHEDAERIAEQAEVLPVTL